MTFHTSSENMFAAVAEVVDATEAKGLDVHTIVLQLNGQHGEFDLWIRSSDEDLEEHETDGTAHRTGGVDQIRHSSGNEPVRIEGLRR